MPTSTNDAPPNQPSHNIPSSNAPSTINPSRNRSSPNTLRDQQISELSAPEENATDVPVRKKRKLQSDVWSYVRKTWRADNKLCWQCMRCETKFSMRTSTGIIRSHLQAHGYLLTKSSQKRFGDSGALVYDIPPPSAEQQESAERNVVDWIVRYMIPFSTVESAEFKRMVIKGPDGNVPSRHTVRRRIVMDHKHMKANVVSLLHEAKGKLSLTADAWSSRIFKGYMVITVHWIDRKWQLRSACLDFRRFPTPHTGDAVKTHLWEVIQEWNLEQRVCSITTDNASDMCSGIKGLNALLNVACSSNRSIESFHVRCLAHVVNLSVKECASLVHVQITKIRSLINSLRSSVKRRDVFEQCTIELGIKGALPSLDSETRWSSTFYMVKRAYELRRVLNGTALRIIDLNDMVISEHEWGTAHTVCEFLADVVTVTEQQSGRRYVTFSLSIMLFNRLRQRCQAKIDCSDPKLSEVAKAMLGKLDAYQAVVESPLAQIARILDPRFRNDLIADGDVLRRNVTIPVPTVPTTPNAAPKKSLLDELMDEDSLSGYSDDEISRFLRNTMTSVRQRDPLAWWAENEARFPPLAKLASDLLAIQATSVASESAFSDAGNLLTPQRAKLSDDIIHASLLLRSWKMALDT